jgi:hypothetical protein
MLASIGGEQNGLLAAGFVIIVCVVLAVVTWYPLSLPSRVIRDDILPDWTCTSETPQTTGMYICSAKVGMLQVAGPLLMMGLIFVFRNQLKARLDKLAPSLPPEGRFLFAPVIATLVFTLSWAGFHFDTADQTGILPQRVFPALVGFTTFGFARWGPDLQRALRGFFDFRDTLPMALRLAVLIGIPLLFSYLLTNQERVSQTATKEQVVVILALALGFLMLAPRTGDALAGMGQVLARTRAG